MDKRGVYFFVIDAFIGAAIVLVSLIVILNTYDTSPESEQPMTLLEDYLTYLQNTQVRDFQGDYTGSLIDEGNISDPSNTLFEQVGMFRYRGEDDLAQKMLSEVTNSSVPQQFSLRFNHGGETVYERKTFPLEDAGLALSSKKVSMVTVNRTEVYGPNIVEVILWTS